MGNNEKVRYAVVGAGWISQAVFMPGISATKNSVLAAVVTGDPEKARVLTKQYELERSYDYTEYDKLLTSGLVDAVYIATPNFDHESYAVRALDAGVHVLLEKPAEVSVERANRIKAAAERAAARGTKFMVAYRLHFEPGTLDSIARVRAGEIGEPVAFSSQFSQKVSPRNHRAKHGFDAGPVPDMGTYPINAVRNFFGAEPLSVFAVGSRHGLGDFDDTVAVTLQFSEARLAQFVVSYVGDAVGAYQIVGTKGLLEMTSGYTFQAGLERTLKIGDEKPKHEKFRAVDQFAGETRYFSDCILKNVAPEPDAEEGFLDLRVIEAIKRSLDTGAVQKLEPAERRRMIDPKAQVQDISARKPPKLVNASAPEEG